MELTTPCPSRLHYSHLRVELFVTATALDEIAAVHAKGIWALSADCSRARHHIHDAWRRTCRSLRSRGCHRCVPDRRDCPAVLQSPYEGLLVIRAGTRRDDCAGRDVIPGGTGSDTGHVAESGARSGIR